MTTKIKIICGFSLLALLIGGIAVFSYQGMQKSSDSFNAYRRMARFNVATSDLDGSVYSAGYHIEQYFLNRNDEEFDAATKALDSARKEVEACMELVKLPSRIASLEAISRELTSFRALMDTARKTVVETHGLYRNTVLPLANNVQDRLTEFGANATKISNIGAMGVISEIWKQFANLRAVMSRYSETRLEQDAARVREILSTGLDPAMKALYEQLRSEEGRRIFAELAGNIAALTSALQNMDKSSAAAAKSGTDMLASLKRLDEMSLAISREVDGEMNALGPETIAANESAQTRTLATGVGGFVLAVLCAVFIIFGIVRVLNQLGAFARAVAAGDFSHLLTVREGGEIGAVFTAMRQIPDVLEQVISQSTELSDKILSGSLRDRLDESKFVGSYADIAKAIGAVCRAYTSLLDSLPTPIMACNRDNSVIFLNSAAQGVLGGNHTNVPCASLIKATACGTQDCFGARAIARSGTHTGETTITPGGRRMEMVISSLALHNSKHETVGFIEVMNDQTDMKDKQGTMMRVAREATEISDRVAAASEQLSAQVEQVSRGAEMQRTRVESTASAMTEMNATVLEVARSAGQASEQSESTRTKAQDGSELVNKVVKSINTVNGVAGNLQGNMQELGKQAESIGGVMNVISDIADQTNLLALNAAIEAARAGEAGRGFAVVADEVRKLAEKTMTATQEVGASITAIQQSARSNINEVGLAVSNITDATALANSSGEALKEIVSLASANSSVVASIATAAEEQSATSEEINRSIDEINRIVAETTDGMVQSSAAVQDLSRMAQELHRVMDGLK